MKKSLFIMLGFLFSSIPVLATCSLDGEACSVAIYDQNIIRAPFKPIYSEYGGSADFGDNPIIRLNPAQRPELDRNFQMKNEGIDINTDSYDSDCQFGVCLPNRNRFN